MSNELDGLMSLPSELRAEFVGRVMVGVKPAYTITVPGDPARMQKLKETLPNISTAHKISDLREDLYDGNPKVTRTMSRAMAKLMRNDLFDIEMSLCGGG